MSSQDVLGRLWLLAEEVASELGFELVEVERGGGGKRQVFRLFIDKAGGVNVEDCALMSRELGGRVEEEDTVASAYVLEVSSPGLERPLRKGSDFSRYAGRPINLRLRARDTDTGRQKFSGILRGIADDVITIDLEEDEGERSFPLGEIAKARLKVDWDTVFREQETPGGGDHGGLAR